MKQNIPGSYRPRHANPVGRRISFPLPRSVRAGRTFNEHMRLLMGDIVSGKAARDA